MSSRQQHVTCVKKNLKMRRRTFSSSVDRIQPACPACQLPWPSSQGYHHPHHHQRQAPSQRKDWYLEQNIMISTKYKQVVNLVNDWKAHPKIHVNKFLFFSRSSKISFRNEKNMMYHNDQNKKIWLNSHVTSVGKKCIMATKICRQTFLESWLNIFLVKELGWTNVPPSMPCRSLGDAPRGTLPKNSESTHWWHLVVEDASWRRWFAVTTSSPCASSPSCWRSGRASSWCRSSSSFVYAGNLDSNACYSAD